MMNSSTTTCQVINSVDKESMTIASKWTDQDLQILILRKGVVPLKGEVCMRNLLAPAKDFNRTEEEYLDEIKRELGGEDEGAEFSVRGSTFQWKKKAWKRGLIECQAINDIIEFSGSMMNVITCCSNMEKSTSDLRVENNALRIKSEELERTLNHMIDLKNHMEEELYKKFIVLLNSKKKKNKELKAKLEGPSVVYDQSTDESETECENTHKSHSISRDLGDLPIKLNQPTSLKKEKTCESNGQQSEAFNASNNDSDESFVLKFSQSPSQETNDKKIFRVDKSDDESGEDLFSD
ncbi:uncharacterized protein LOC107044502 [Diachasma alloeum]|uniref:uncharacterized protein LOC107044502 n=1 Tax=Diachasma alloeum TaxID=454923 RepID=UPI0007383DAF|nr:uncharacterized protein LOC107044502 [Diachasma alloeum]